MTVDIDLHTIRPHTVARHNGVVLAGIGPFYLLSDPWTVAARFGEGVAGIEVPNGPPNLSAKHQAWAAFEAVRSAGLRGLSRYDACHLAGEAARNRWVRPGVPQAVLYDGQSARYRRAVLRRYVEQLDGPSGEDLRDGR